MQHDIGGGLTVRVRTTVPVIHPAVRTIGRHPKCKGSDDGRHVGSKAGRPPCCVSVAILGNPSRRPGRASRGCQSCASLRANRESLFVTSCLVCASSEPSGEPQNAGALLRQWRPPQYPCLHHPVASQLQARSFCPPTLGVVTSTLLCIDWQPAAAAPGGAAQVQLATFQAVKAFLPRCKVSRTQGSSSNDRTGFPG